MWRDRVGALAVNWPVYRRITGTDRFGRRRALRSPPTEAAQPPTDVQVAQPRMEGRAAAHGGRQTTVQYRQVFHAAGLRAALTIRCGDLPFVASTYCRLPFRKTG